MTIAALPGRRTIRRYAHELYPHPAEGEVRPLRIEVPYLYAVAIGLQVLGTDWHDLRDTDEGRRLTVTRTQLLVQARDMALLADAINQGMTHDQAWAWAATRYDETGEITYDRATAYGVPVERIKPYPVIAEPDHHDHYDKPDAAGWRTVHHADGPESACLECTEPIPEEDTPLPLPDGRVR